MNQGGAHGARQGMLPSNMQAGQSAINSTGQSPSGSQMWAGGSPNFNELNPPGANTIGGGQQPPQLPPGTGPGRMRDPGWVPPGYRPPPQKQDWRTGMPGYQPQQPQQGGGYNNMFAGMGNPNMGVQQRPTFGSNQPAFNPYQNAFQPGAFNPFADRGAGGRNPMGGPGGGEGGGMMGGGGGMPAHGVGGNYARQSQMGFPGGWRGLQGAGLAASMLGIPMGGLMMGAGAIGNQFAGTPESTDYADYSGDYGGESDHSGPGGMSGSGSSGGGWAE